MRTPHAGTRTHTHTHTPTNIHTVTHTHQRALAMLCANSAIHPTVRHVHGLGAPALPSSHPPHLISIDWRFVRAVSPDDSAVAPSAPRSLPLQEETGEVGGDIMAPVQCMPGSIYQKTFACDSVGRERASVGREDSAGLCCGIGQNRTPAAPGQRAARIDELF